jgi:uncharacterized protein YdiU (UPF0061 family)
MDEYDPATVFSSIDRQGRYAYANQPTIGHWNLTRLAECLLPLLSDDEDKAVAEAQEALDAFGPSFEKAYRAGLTRKLGLAGADEHDLALAQDLLKAMSANRADFTLTFRRLSDAAGSGDHTEVRSLFADPTQYDEWARRWQHRLQQEPGGGAACGVAMKAVNPAYIPRNHRVEAVIRAGCRPGRPPTV